MKKFIVELKPNERQKLENIAYCGQRAAYKIQRANILLKSDQGEHGPAWIDAKIAESFGCTVSTVERIRKRFVEAGIDGVLTREQRPPRRKKIDGETEAVLIATACSTPPEGHSRWTVRLLSNKLVELGAIDSCSRMTVQRALKKIF